MKRTFLLLLILALTAGAVFAHDKGDLMLNIEPQIGIAFPVIEPKKDGVALSSAPDSQETVLGLDLGVNGTVHYYFFDFFAVNAGLGINGFYDAFTQTFDYQDGVDTATETFNIEFANFYFSVPFGVRFSLGAFAVGAGMTANFPIFTSSSSWGTASMTVDGWTKPDATKRVNDDNYFVNPYMGWYADIGFDLSGRKGRSGGFGMLGRFSGSFDDKIAGTSTAGVEYDPFQQFAISLVFQAGIQLASIPIGGR